MGKHESIRELTEWGVEHADPNCEQHGEDKRVGDLRRRIQWVPADVDIEAEELSYGAPAPGGGFMIRYSTPPGIVSAPVARETDAEPYKAELRRINETRRQIRRLVQRNGRWRMETQRIHQVAVKNRDGTITKREAHPVRELVCEPTPWVSKLLRESLTLSEQKRAHLRLATVALREIERTGVEALGGGVHQDTGCDHYHLHFSIVSADRKLTPHAKLAVTGRWPCRMKRLQSWGVGELRGQKAEWFARAMERNPRGLDVRINEAIDAESRKICEEHSLDLNGALDGYKRWKPTASKDYFLSQALKLAGQYHAATGIKILETAWHEKALSITSTLAGASLATSVALDKLKEIANKAKFEEAKARQRIDEMNSLLDSPSMPPPRR